MNTAFKTTIEEVIIVAQQLNVILTIEMAEELLKQLDTDLIEDAALSVESFYEEGDDEFDGDMQKQVDAAMEEIRSQLQENQLFISMKYNNLKYIMKYICNENNFKSKGFI